MMQEKAVITDFLTNPSKLLVIGASNKKHRAGHYVPKFLQSKGFEIIPINPNEETVLGEKSYGHYSEYEGRFNAVLMYRNVKAAKETALDILDKYDIDLLWFPDNIVSQTVATEAKNKNVDFIQDRCPLRDYRALIA